MAGQGRSGRRKVDSLVVRTARVLAGLSMGAADGDHLGSENELLEQLGISRPTLRQAAKIVENDRLIAVRRGIKGGFYATRPDARDVIRAPALYLRMNGATIVHVHAVARLISEEAAAEAARCADKGLREEMRVLRGRIDADEASNQMPAQVIQRESELAQLLGRMSGNPAIALFMEISYMFGLLSPDLQLYDSPDDRSANRARQRNLCDAILTRDPDVARLMMKRRSEMITGWLAQAVGKAGAG